MYYLLSAIAYFMGKLSNKGATRVARILTFIGWDLLRIRRKLIVGNVRNALGIDHSEAEILRIGRLSVYNFVLSLVEFYRSLEVDIAQCISIENRQHIDQALAKGQGAYVLCFHMGNWEAMGAAVTRFVRPARVIVKKVGSDNVNRFVTKLRMHNGFYPLLKLKKGDVFERIKHYLSEGDIIGFVIDQARSGSPKMDFFGKPAKTNTSFAAIWSKSKAPIIPAYFYRTDIGKHTLCFEPEILMRESENKEEDILFNSLKFNKIVENIVCRHPEQYFWMHNRWK